MTFDDQDPRNMQPSSGASGGQSPSTQASSGSVGRQAPAPSQRATGRQAASRRPVGPRIIDMTRQVFQPSRIQPPPDITIEYVDAHGRPAPRLNHQVEREFLDDVAAEGIRSIRIGYTTNGQHSPHSNHPLGLAADIDMINGKPVNAYHRDPEVRAWVDGIINRFNARHDHEVYGPGRQLYRDRRPFHNPTLERQHEGHIHWTRRR